MAFLPFVQTILAQGETVNTNTFQQNKDLLSAFLQNVTNATIRVYVTATSGFGHMANTVNIMKRLIVLGFNQNMQVIYDDAPTVPTTIQKLAILIPGLNPINPQPIVFNGINVSFITTAAFAVAPQPVVDFGITGGYDSNQVNLASITNTRVFLKLQPYQWRQENTLFLRNVTEGSTVRTNLADVDVLGGRQYAKKNYYLPIPAMTAADYVEFTASAPTKVAPYQAIIAACGGDDPAANMMPVYGIGDSGNDHTVEALYGIKPESILFNLIASIAYTQEFSDVDKLKKGAIIVVIATVSEDPCYINLNQALTGTVGAAPLLNAYATGADLATNVDVISFDDHNFDVLLQGVQENPFKILVVKMNGLPATPFNYLYNQSTLPSMFEGKGTASLALNIPIPFYYLNAGSIIYPTLPLNAPNGADALYCNAEVKRLNDDFARINTLFSNGGFDATSIYSAGQFLWRLSEAEGNIPEYYTNLPAFYHQEQNDKLINALFYMLHSITES